MTKKQTQILIICTLSIILNACGGRENTERINSNIAAPVANSAAIPANTNANTNVNANVAAPKQLDKASAALPVTLPVLDAMFADESFTSNIKDKVQLTDEQINKLKEISHQSIGNLQEGTAADKSSTSNAVKSAEEQIKNIIGFEKTNQLFQLIQENWNEGGSESDATAKPNAIPTDTRVVVNAPSYRMDIFKDGQIVKSYKIGIGYPEFPLPSGIRKAETIIFNPTWTPPDEPWVKGKVKPGEKIEAGSSMNPLGPIKIPIGSPSLIHGGKSPAKLGMFNSHGCVGLTNSEVQDFALQLAQVTGTALTADDVQNYRKEKDKTKNVKLGQTMPVELRYETIVVENGILHIYRDVYERGTNTLANLKKVLDSYGVSYDELNAANRQQILAALKEMNKDGNGQQIVENLESGSDPQIAQKDNKKDENKNGNVTRSIKGGKEVTVTLTELQGKGYPAAVNLNTGT